MISRTCQTRQAWPRTVFWCVTQPLNRCLSWLTRLLVLNPPHPSNLLRICPHGRCYIACVALTVPERRSMLHTFPMPKTLKLKRYRSWMHIFLHVRGAPTLFFLSGSFSVVFLLSAALFPWGWGERRFGLDTPYATMTSRCWPCPSFMSKNRPLPLFSAARARGDLISHGDVLVASTMVSSPFP